jgi:hypothetical protein
VGIGVAVGVDVAGSVGVSVGWSVREGTAVFVSVTRLLVEVALLTVGLGGVVKRQDTMTNIVSPPMMHI